MVFDVETTGLLPPKKDPISKVASALCDFPYILQLSFVIYNTNLRCIERTFNKYIRVPDSVEISPKIIELTGITRELCNSPEQSITIEEALCEFYHEYCNCDCIVAHNIDFDKTLIMTEMERNGPAIVDKCPYYSCIFDPEYNKINNIDTFCTMRIGKKICNIVVQPPDKIDEKTGNTITPKPYVKYPRLSELHQHLMGSVPDGLHNSLVDTMACLNCYIALRFRPRS
jgi:DNA polymerase III epsilon subunit-like protein